MSVGAFVPLFLPFLSSVFLSIRCLILFFFLLLLLQLLTHGLSSLVLRYSLSAINDGTAKAKKWRGEGKKMEIEVW